VIRLFAALDLPEDVRHALPDPGDGWRRVGPESLHVTLAFLGWREESDVERVLEAVGGALTPIALLTLGKVVLLPPRRPRVMAVELEDPAGSSVALQTAVSSSLAGAGLYEPERRPWLPHVTIGRARGPVRRGAPVPEVPALDFLAPSVTVYRSVLGRGGAQYEPLGRFGLDTIS
jgi:2'-5' RNA ligase